MENLQNEDIIAHFKGEADSLLVEEQQSIISSSEYQKISSHLDLYKKLPELQPSPKLWLKISDQIRQESTPPKISKTPKIPAFRYTSMAASLFVAVYLFSSFFYNSEKVQLVQGMAQISSPFGTIQEGWSGHIEPKTIIKTPENATTKLILSKKISCTLGFNTSLQLLDNSTISLQQGKVYLEVTPGTPLKILTKHGSFQVLGTAFTIDSQPQKTLLSVYKGRVQFDGLQQKIVEKGSAISVSESTIQSRKINPNDIPWWVGIPFSITANKIDNHIQLAIANLSKTPLSLNVPNGNPPFILKVQHQNNFYDTPLPIGSKVIEIPGYQEQSLDVDISQILKKPGIYNLRVLYQGKIDSQKPWNGVVISNAMQVEIK